MEILGALGNHYLFYQIQVNILSFLFISMVDFLSFTLNFMCFRVTFFKVKAWPGWKERGNEIVDSQGANDPNTMQYLRECGLAKFFLVQGMRAQIFLLDHLIGIWDPKQKYFQVGTHILTLDV